MGFSRPAKILKVEHVTENGENGTMLHISFNPEEDVFTHQILLEKRRSINVPKSCTVNTTTKELQVDTLVNWVRINLRKYKVV